ncbi:MAG: hypothetical protein H7A40_01375 [Chlamydiales bacterium]|nr:hypothetical protein [Chlamydiales bacterium]
MSRSHRKPYFREENKKPKKKAANKSVRQASEDVPNGAHYRKLYDSYKIDDFGLLTENPKLKRK